MYSQTARYYDLIYRQFKDYPNECRLVDEFVRTHLPSAKRLLDVACGSGTHAEILSREYGYQVDGLDLEPDFVEIAGGKAINGSIYHADMTDFDLGTTYDVILCLFSSIAYAKTEKHIIRALTCFRKHLAGGGMILVEPWFAPDEFFPGRVHLDTAEDENTKICRMAYSDAAGTVSRIHFEYLLGTGEGLAHFSEIHELGLLTKAQMLDCFHRAGLDVSYQTGGFCGRGLYIARML
ncbi:MAG: class I SAM-dependent methyltransferase [candidate division Zixibacteria bacterium]|nr:class I SAM-dependent methyltransferase [candidate division Zixibacteria bacterium]